MTQSQGCFHKSGVLEELWISERHWQVGRKKLLPVVNLFLGRLPWRRGKRLNMCWNPWLGTENDFNHLVLWYDDHTTTWNFRSKKSAWNQKSFILEELQIFECYWQIPHEKSPHFLRISSHYVPWWRSSKMMFDFFVDFWPKIDLHFFFEDDEMIWWYEDMMRWYDDMNHMMIRDEREKQKPWHGVEGRRHK